MNWYIGQEVVCVKTHVQRRFKEGEIFRIESLKSPFCSCPDVRINIGVRAEVDIDVCGLCGHVHPNTDGVHWFSENYFAPLMDITELKEILNEEIQRV